MTISVKTLVQIGAATLLLNFAHAQNAALDPLTPKDLIVEPPTLIALGFEWYVDGDDDGDATGSVSYRKSGETTWQTGQPLLRVNRLDRSGQYGPVAERSKRPNLLTGSVFDLTPDTEYEVKLTLADPDGVTGSAEKTLKARTRAEPKPAEGGRVFHVYPPTHKGAVTQPAFVGIMAAYLQTQSVAADHYNVYPPRVRAGDTILVHAGLYKDNWHYYSAASFAIPENGRIPDNATCCGATFHGTYFLTADGTAEKPIVIRAAGDGEVVFDGDGNDTLFNLVGGNYHYFEGLTFRNTKTAIQAGWKDIGGSTGLTVKHSRFENVGVGIHGDWSGAQNFYIADNVFIGRHNPAVLAPFNATRRDTGTVFGSFLRRLSEIGTPPEASELKSEYAVKVYGSGHVIAHNRVDNFHDGIDHATYGVPVGWPDVPRDQIPVANDFYNNVISNMHDECIEVDGMLYNARVLRNLCVNAAGSFVSTQGPALSGPIYIVRNIAYHVPGGFATLKNTTAYGIRMYNNTFVSAVRANSPSGLSDFRNNLILAEFPEESAYAFAFRDGSPTTDYNGYMAGADSKAPFMHITPAGPITGAVMQAGERKPFASLAEFSKATGQDRHSRMIDYSVFQKLQPTDTVQVTRVYDPLSLSFELRPRGKAIDAGVAIPNVTEGHRGRAPDLGALESGAPLPVFGPR